MGAVRVFLGIIFCLTIGVVLIFIFNYQYVPGQISEISFLELYQLPFYLILHPYYSFTFGQWIVLLALIAGAFVGGLLAKGTRSGLVMGFGAWLLNILLYVGIVWFFNFNTLSPYWASLGNTLYIDLVLSFLLLELFGALGGKITANSG